MIARFHSFATALGLVGMLTLGNFTCSGSESSPAKALDEAALTQISFHQQLNSQVSLNLPFRDEHGSSVALGQYAGTKPLILVMGYYRCPMLCTLIDNSLIESLEDVKWSIGRKFSVIHISIDPNETPQLAAAKKATCLKRYGRTGAETGWHFLTGAEPAIRTLAKEVGFDYLYDPVSHEYAHPSGLVILTPGGKISSYLFGVTFSPKEVYGDLAAASADQIASPLQNLVLLCFHYNPIRGKYGAVIMMIVRLLSVLTLVGLGWIVFRVARQPSVCTQEAGALIPVESARTGAQRLEECAAPASLPAGEAAPNAAPSDNAHPLQR